MIEFAGMTIIEPQLLWLVAALPIFILLTWWGTRRRKRDMKRFSDAKLFQMLNPSLITKGKYGLFRQIIFLSATVLLVVAIARPGGDPIFEEEEVTKKGLDIILMVDLSSSMAATDLQPNRLEATKVALKSFIDQVVDDRIGLVVFAGSASLQAPLTQDFRTAKMMIDILSTNFLPIEGTAIGDSLDFTLEKLGEERQKGAVVILLTDGENTKGKSPNEAIDRAKKVGTIVYTIGVGSKEGAKIPDGKDEQGNIKYKMYHGEQVITKLDEKLLQKIADQTNGKYYSADTAESLMQVYREISRLTKTERTEKKKKAKYKEYYVWLAIPALFLLLMDIFLNRKSSWLPKRFQKVKQTFQG